MMTTSLEFARTLDFSKLRIKPESRRGSLNEWHQDLGGAYTAWVVTDEAGVRIADIFDEGLLVIVKELMRQAQAGATVSGSVYLQP